MTRCRPAGTVILEKTGVSPKGLAGKSGRLETLHAPLCVAATVPEIVLEPVSETGNGNGAPMVTLGRPPCALACGVFMREPTTARIPIATKTISLFRSVDI